MNANFSQKDFYIEIKLSKFAPHFAPWCNGSTSVFGAVSLGSSPGGVTKKRPL